MEPLYTICIGDLQIRPHEHVVIARGQEVPLTFREFAIVMTLAEHPGWVYTPDQLSQDAEVGDYSPESVSVLVSRVRKKLAAAGVTGLIETVRGIGYRLESSSSRCGDELPSVGGVNRELMDALWRLQEAVVEVQLLGDEGLRAETLDLIERTNSAVYASLRP